MISGYCIKKLNIPILELFFQFIKIDPARPPHNPYSGGLCDLQILYHSIIRWLLHQDCLLSIGKRHPAQDIQYLLGAGDNHNIFLFV